MLTNATSPALRRLGAGSRALVSLYLAALAAGCSGLLDVENPNNVNQDNLDNPAAAAALANGALSATARAFGTVLTPYSEATDELTWIGSRDAWGDLDLGYLTGITNEFVDAAFPSLAQARWLSDEAIKRLSAFAAVGVLPDSNDLARSYLYGAIAYVTIGDMFDDWPIGSDRTQAAAPLGPANMAQVYDTAIAYTTRGITIAQATGNTGLELDLTAMRARARHARGVWVKLNPFSAATLANPLVNDPLAVADANAALALASGTPDWMYRFNYSSETIGTSIGFEVNQRLESRFGDPYIFPTADNKRVDSIRLRDPIDAVPDPVLTKTINDFVTGVQYGSLTVVSSREMYLILAESRLAQNDSVGAATFINNIRALDAGLTPYDPLNAAHPRALAMYQHERRVNLFLQGRRLADHYRFGVPADKWPANAEAVLQPGTVFPITNVEILANCHINGTC
jgi:hypothetical protein